MVTGTVAGPFAELTLAGVAAPWYVIEFDKDGACTSPQSRDHLLRAVRDGASHVFIFAHGWNNSWADVRDMSGAFFRGFAALSPGGGPGFRPIFVTIFWPSIALVLPEERGPRFAAADPAADQADERAVESLARAVPARRRDRLRALAAQDALTQGELESLARILAPLYRRPDEVADAEAPGAAELVALWRAAAAELGAGDASSAGDGEFGFADDELPADDPAAAGGLIDWVRLPYRMATVWQMKDRAGVVGSRGVGRLLRAILAASPTARLHLAGHSYGCRVLLSALSVEPTPRPAESLLLLQPAVSHLCFAEQIAETGRPGGFRPALDRVAQPIVCTFSDHDWPLHDFFHLAIRRPDDLGEARIAGAPPSRFAALGGYGPGGLGSAAVTLAIKARGEDYPLRPGGPRLIAVDGSGVQKPGGSPAISHHGDINHEMAWWLMASQVAAS
jgi:hypothetical protein